MSTTTTTEEPSWWRLGSDGWREVAKRTAGQFKHDRVQLLASGVTLRIVLALVPSLIAAVAIAAQFVSPDDIHGLVESAQEFIPPESQDFVTGQLQDILMELQRGEVGVIGVVLGVFAASSAAIVLITALNTAYGVHESRKFLRLRATSLAVIGALGLALAGMFTALVLGPSLVAAFVPEVILDSPLRYLITIGRYLAAFLLLILFFGFTFWIGPDRDRPDLLLMSPGAVAGVVGWVVLSYLFSVYVRLAGSYSATYGAAAGIVVLLVWLMYSFTVLLMGAELNDQIERYLKEQQPARVPLPVGSPVAGLDEVTADMPRHAGLLAAAEASSPAGSDDDVDRPDRPSAPPPMLIGAASRTSGASVAALVWRFVRG